MKYVIAGGGSFGSHYLQKLTDSIRSRSLAIDEIVVVDRDPLCAASELIPTVDNTCLQVTGWRDFGRSIWEDRAAWNDSVWVPAPIAPHILASWLLDRLLVDCHVGAIRSREIMELPNIPYAKTLLDGRVLLSHAPGTCPVGCIEPQVCAITEQHRTWEMRQTIERLSGCPKAVAMFFCKHHCDAGEHDVGGIRFDTIFAEYDRICNCVKNGEPRIGVATFSSCHGVLNAYEMVPVKEVSRCAACASEFWCGAEGLCWCADLPPVSMLDESRACYCPNCLPNLTRVGQPDLEPR